MTRKELEELAKHYNISFNDDTTDDELSEAIGKAKDAESAKKNTDDQDLDYWKAEAKKAFEKRDSEAKIRRDLAKKIKDLEAKQTGLPTSEEISALRDELKELREFKLGIDEERKKAEEAKLDEVGKAKAHAERTVKDLQDKFDQERREKEEALEKEKTEKSALQRKLESVRLSKLEGDIIKVAAKLDAFNPEQVGRMLLNDFEYDQELDRYVKYVRDKKGQISKELYVDEYVEEFLKDDNNSNLVRSNVNTHSFQSQKSSDKIKNHSGDLGGYSITDSDIIERAKFEGMDPERYIKRVLIPKDKAMNKNKESGENKSP